jgi:hypothetical protein
MKQLQLYMRFMPLVVLALVLPLAAHFTGLVSNSRIDVRADLLPSPSPAEQFATQTDAPAPDPSLTGIDTSHFGPTHAGEEDGNDNLFVSVGILGLLTVLALTSAKAQRIQRKRAQSDSGGRKLE